MPHTAIREFGRRIREFGTDWDETTDDEPKIGLPDDQITTWIDTVAFAEKKYRALEAHASQPDNAFFLKLGLPVFTELFGSRPSSGCGTPPVARPHARRTCSPACARRTRSRSHRAIPRRSALRRQLRRSGVRTCG